MTRMFEMRQKEVINIRDGFRFGFLYDIGIDMCSGTVIEIIIPGPSKMFGIFGFDHEYRIPFVAIKQIGEDVILVDVDTEKVLIQCEF